MADQSTGGLSRTARGLLRFICRWHLLQLGRDLNNIALVVAIMIVIVVIGVAVDRLLFGPVDSWVRHRWGLTNA